MHSVDCGKITSFANGEVIGPDTVLDSEVTFSCNMGYSLVGNSTRVCQSNGNWSGYASCEGKLYSLFIQKFIT